MLKLWTPMKLNMAMYELNWNNIRMRVKWDRRSVNMSELVYFVIFIYIAHHYYGTLWYLL